MLTSSPSTKRFIDKKTNRPCFGNKGEDVYVSGQEWRLNYPVYVDEPGLLTTLTSKSLDDAIADKRLMTGDEWRQKYLFTRVEYSQYGEMYVDALTGLPPIDPETYALLDISREIARPKIINGEWIRIKEFMIKYGEIVFVKRGGERTELVGSALFQALAEKRVRGQSIKATFHRMIAVPKGSSEPNLSMRLMPTPPSFFSPIPIPAHAGVSSSSRGSTETPDFEKFRGHLFESSTSSADLLSALSTSVTDGEHPSPKRSRSYSTYDLDAEFYEFCNTLPPLSVTPAAAEILQDLDVAAGQEEKKNSFNLIT